jgi:polysaccharide pyruvyl transferase WcaK-like protein
MQVLVDQSGYELRNSGDMAMLVACVKAVQTHLPGAGVSVLTTQPSALVELAPTAVPVRVAPPLTSLGPLRRSDLQSAWRYGYKFVRPWLPAGRSKDDDVAGALARADLVISSGGGFLNDQFVSHASGVLSVLNAAQRRGVPTAMFGQGLGPLTNPWLKGLARRFLPKLDRLGLREGAVGPDLAAELGVPADIVCVTGDDALRLAGAGSPPAAGTFLGVNLRMSSYSAVDADHAGEVRAALHDFVSVRNPGLLALPVSSYANHFDLCAIASILPETSGEVVMEELPTPQSLAEATGNCRAVVTGSYHVAVFALARGIPVVGVSRSTYYDLKFEGLQALFSDLAVQLVSLSGDAARANLERAINEAWDLDDAVRAQTADQAAELARRQETFIGGFLGQFA